MCVEPHLLAQRSDAHAQRSAGPSTSAPRTWHGWLKSVSPLITGTSEYSASSRMSECANNRAMTTSFMLARTREMSLVASRLPILETRAGHT